MVRGALLWSGFTDADGRRSSSRPLLLHHYEGHDLLLTQSLLVRAGGLRLHRTLGNAAIVLVVLMVLTGFTVVMGKPRPAGMIRILRFIGADPSSWNLVSYAFVLLPCVIYDLWRLRKIHPATLYGGAVLLLRHPLRRRRVYRLVAGRGSVADELLMRWPPHDRVPRGL